MVKFSFDTQLLVPLTNPTKKVIILKILNVEDLNPKTTIQNLPNMPHIPETPAQKADYSFTFGILALCALILTATHVLEKFRPDLFPSSPRQEEYSSYYTPVNPSYAIENPLGMTTPVQTVKEEVNRAILLAQVDEALKPRQTDEEILAEAERVLKETKHLVEPASKQSPDNILTTPQ